MLATQVILCVTIIGNTALLTVVLLERRSRISMVFALYVGSVAAWAFAIFLNLFLKSLFVEEWIFAIAACTLTLQLWFAKLFPDGNLPSRLREYWSLALGCFFVLASFYPGALFHSIAVHTAGYTTLDNGSLSAEYSLFALVYVCAPIWIFFRKYWTEHDEKLKRQLKYFTIGFFLFAAIAVLTNSVLPVFFHIYELNAIGPSFSLVFAVFMFYIIGKHQFLDIRAAVQRAVIYTFLISIIVVAYEALLIVTGKYFGLIPRLLAWDSDIAEPITAVVVTVLGIVTAPYIERYFQKLTDRIFFKEKYDYVLALQGLSEILHTSTDFDELIQRIQKSLADILRAETVQILLQSGEGIPSRARQDERSPNENRMLLEPIYADGKEIGVISVGEKRSGDRYRVEDAQLVRTVSLHAATALGRAQLFRQVQGYALELEKKVTERTAELRASHERERSMMQDIAHNLQTPLTVFRTKFDGLKSLDKDALDLRAFERPLTDLSDFIDNLLKLAHLEHSSDKPLFKTCDLSDLLSEIVEEIEIIADGRHIQIDSEIADNVRVRADPKELRSAIMNLANNAIKYMRPDGERTVAFRLTKDAKDACLSIRDTGIGIAQDNLSHIFDRFYRVNEPYEASGSGLGLAISKKIIENHDGTLHAESVVGRGTTMTIRLPLETRDA